MFQFSYAQKVYSTLSPLEQNNCSSKQTFWSFLTTKFGFEILDYLVKNFFNRQRNRTEIKQYTYFDRP